MAKFNDVNVGQMEACITRMGGMPNSLRYIGGQGELVFKAILALVTTVKLPAQPRFVAREKFVKDTSDKAVVKIAYIWDGFNRFLNKVEEPVGEMELAVPTLTKDLQDQEIREELGAEKEETPLSQFYAMLARQGHGQKGDLLTDGYANIFYIRDGEGTLWAVRAYWYSDSGGWGVDAGSVTNPHRWDAGNQVVSRN